MVVLSSICLSYSFLMVVSLIFTSKVSARPIDCDNLKDEDMKNVKKVVYGCKDWQSLGRDVAAEPKPLDISSLSDWEFESLFKNKQSLKMGIRAVNSRIQNMIFPRLTSLDDRKSIKLLEVVNNRLLKQISLPMYANRTLFSSFDRTMMPLRLEGNPLITRDNINYFRSLIHRDIDWISTVVPNSPGTCVLTQVVRDMAELDNCKIIDSGLFIDEAVGETKAKIQKVYGNISITNSNITNIDFLSPGAWPKTWSLEKILRYDLIHNNPNLCISDEQMNNLKLRKTSPSVLNNKNKHLCDQPAEEVCIGGSLSDDDTRTRIENRNCIVIQGDLLIENVINNESDLTDELRTGLSRVRQIIDGSLVVTHNDGLFHFDFMKDLEKVYPGIDPWSGACEAPGIAIWANFNLKRVKLNMNISVYDNAERCTQIYIGANGEEGRERVISDEDYEQLGNNVKGIIIWNHPRDRKAVEKEDEEMVRLYWSIGGCIASTILCILGGALYFYKMSHAKDSEENESTNKSETKSKKDDAERAKSVYVTV